MTDLEGATGVFKLKQTREKETHQFRVAIRLLMGDVAAGDRKWNQTTEQDMDAIRVGVVGVRRGGSFTRGAGDAVGMKLVAACVTGNNVWKNNGCVGE